MTTQELEKITAARDYIQARSQLVPQFAVILGSGLGALADEVEVDTIIPYS